MKEFIITDNNSGQRLDKYIFRLIDKSSMSFIYKMLRKKNFVLNDKKATGKEIIKSGDVVKLFLSDETYDKFKTEIDLSDLTSVAFNSKQNHNEQGHNKQGVNKQSDNHQSQNKINNKSKKNSEFSDFSVKNCIVYEDNDILIINKPAGILSQKANKNDVSINEYALNYLLQEKGITEEQLTNYRPSAVNRLDRNTTGIILVAKNLHAAQYLSEALKNRTIKKYYKCIVCGLFDRPGLHKGYLTKDSNSNKVTISKDIINTNSDYIETEYECFNTINNELSELKVHLITGKSHQIRAHLAYLGYPILGDRKYGNRNCNMKYKADNQLLHAYKIVFPDSDNSKFLFNGKSFECEPDFRY